MAASDETVGFEFVEYEIFSEQMSIVGAEVLLRIQSDLVQNPTRGAIVKRTHGVRKARVADPTSTRGRAAVIDICISTSNTPAESTCLYLFSKGEQADLSPKQKQIIGALSQKIRGE